MPMGLNRIKEMASDSKLKLTSSSESNSSHLELMSSNKSDQNQNSQYLSPTLPGVDTFR